MHFQHPELLYALFLLLIPIIVHLFRLRKFQKEDFTNVKFLKKVIQETRKSSKLKKFLVLCTRLLLFTCIILAFAQPFFPASEKALQEKANLIYLDNSFSMEAPAAQSNLFSKAVNQLIENLKENENYAFLTNTGEISEYSGSELKNVLQSLELSGEPADFRSTELKAENYFSKISGVSQEFIMISDFQQPSEILNYKNNNFSHHLIQMKPVEINNISIDTAFISDSNPENFHLNISLSATRYENEPIAVSIYNGEQLLGRNTLSFDNSEKASIQFRLQNKEIADGRIEIDDNSLSYDNTLFFSIGEKTAIQTVIISDAENAFLQKIFSEPEFNTSSFSPSQTDFNTLNSANLVILNEVNDFSASLVNNLENIYKNGASVVIIPSDNATNYSSLLNRFQFAGFSEKIETERFITNIEFDHPLLEGVFEDRTQNFDYPKVFTSFKSSSGNPILKYQDGSSFLTENNDAYLFTAALNKKNSNFTNSPLVVPVLYQIGLQSLKDNQLYYLTFQNNSIDIPVEVGLDEVLHLVKEDENLIPQQQNFNKHIEISTANLDLGAGNFSILKEETKLGTISFNYGRNESILNYSDLSAIENSSVYDSIDDYFSQTNAASEITLLWKWFVIFALIFLAIEMLLLKFLK